MATNCGDELVTISEVERMTTLERTTIWRKYRAGEFPQPRYIGERRVWPKSEIEAWLKAEMSRPASARHGARNLNAVARALGVEVDVLLGRKAAP